MARVVFSGRAPDFTQIGADRRRAADLDFAAKYLTAADFKDVAGLYGLNAALLMTQVLNQCGDDLSRENIMRQALNIKGFVGPLALPGATLNTSPTNYFPIRQMQLSRFNGESWELFGELMSD